MKDKYIKRLSRIEKNQQEILEKLDQIISGQNPPVTIPWSTPKTSVCSLCGIDLMANNMYYCSRNDCPTQIKIR